MQDLVAVTAIIPAFNAQKFLLQAASSVLNQTMPDLHLVIVDDGSTDRTLEIARSIRDERVSVCTIRNQGPAHARNLGCTVAKPSRYVGFLDADDMWDADKLAEQIAYLEGNPDVLGVGCFMRYISSTGKPLGETGQIVGQDELDQIARGELLPFPVSSLLVRRSAYNKVGGFDECFRHSGAEDLDFYARLAGSGRIDCVPKVLGSYRIHADSTMARHRVRINREARFVRQRLALRESGRELTWEEFVASHRPTWRERRQDAVEVCYRSAALWYGEGRWVRAMGYVALACLVDPKYTLRRLYLQRFRGRPTVRHRTRKVGTRS